MDRYTVTALIHYHENTTRRPLGTAPSRRKARRLGYIEGRFEYPLYSTMAIFEIEIIDTTTGERVRADWAEVEARNLAHNLRTVGERGVW